MGQTTFSLAAYTWINVNNPDTNYSSATNPHLPAILKFTNTGVNLKYKKITKAVAYLYGFDYVGWSSSGPLYPAYPGNIKLQPYSTNSGYNELTYNNYTNKGVAGEEISYSTSRSRYGYSDRTEYTYDPIDITGIFVNGLNSDKFEMIATDSLVAYLSTSSSITVTYEDSVQPAPTPSYPVSTYLRENETFTFAWGWNSATGATQKSVDIAYKLVSASSWTTVSLTQTNYSYKLTSGLPQGEYVWKIRGTNEVDETSAYSADVKFNVVGKPSIPVINTPENVTLTQITWNATNQAAYELKLTDSNGVEILHETNASAETVYAPNMFLMGNYTVGIAYCNTSGYWSDMAYKTFTINPAGPAQPNASAECSGNNVIIEFENDNTVNLAIMRSDNGSAYKVITVIYDDSTTYTDTTVIPGVNYTYVVRSYADGYADSDPMEISVDWNGAVINSANKEVHLILSTDKFAPYTKRLQRDVVLTNYSGREYALAERGEYKNDIVSVKFYITVEQAPELESFMDTECYYRDDHGNSYKCCLTSMQYSGYMNDGYEITLEVSRVAESEVVVNV